MPEEDPIIAEFVIESREHLADIENQLLAIEAGGSEIDPRLVNTVFRAIHSIKGASGFFGFSVLGELAHHLESILNLVRNRELIPDSVNIDVMLRAADTIREMVEDIYRSNKMDISSHVTELQGILNGTIRQADSPDAGPTPAGQPSQSEHGVRDEASAGGYTDTRNESELPPPSRYSREDARTEAGGFGTTVLSASSEASVRVSVKLLDSLMNLAGELVLSRNQLIQKVGLDRNPELESVAARLDQVTSEIQEAIMQTRMQVIGTVFGKFPRVVRDLSRQLGKECVLTLEGEEVELDKSIIEAIGDPLTHLVRNSVDHGIEPPQKRRDAGKPPQGSIVLRAFHQAGKVNISISDDGAGIDAAKLKEQAVGRGLITTEQAAEMGDREAHRLIFHPGLSMAKEVTGVSGRGVGMDVVKTNIEKLGGTVGIETEAGRGTTVNIKLPLTLAIIPSLIVRCMSRRFAIPQTNIRELVRIKRQDVEDRIEQVKDAEVLRLREKLLPLVRLDAALGIERTDNGTRWSAVNIIVVEAGHLQYGLIVDGLHDSEEIVVKPLGRHMQGCHALAGATILGDGQVALILDVAGIASHCRLAAPEEAGPCIHDESAADYEDTQTSLLFTNHPEERFGIPMEAISRLERVRRDAIDTVGGVEVLQYRGASLPLLALEKLVRTGPPEQGDTLFIIVFSVQKREVGLIAPRLIDILDISANVDTVTFREPGVVGSVEVDGRATRLLDPYELTKRAFPDWFVSTEPSDADVLFASSSSDAPRRRPRILLAEDSNFFRKQVTGFLEECKCDVVGCEDGLVAWNVLQECGEDFDLVVTDIQMPNMDGCQLAQKIKADPALARLRVIALTSLAGEEDMRRGLESGIDDYQIKLDRERLMAAVAGHLENVRRRSAPYETPVFADIESPV